MEMTRPINFKDLRDLHKCANDLLVSPMIQQALVQPQQDTSTLQDISETILEMLDLCGATRDALLLAKEHLQQLHSTARRTLLEESEVLAHNLRRKKLKKEMAKCLRSLKEMNKYNKCFFNSDLSLVDPGLIVVVHVLREVRVATICILESLLRIISSNLRQRSGRGQSSLATRISQRLFDKWESSARVYYVDGMTETVLEAGLEDLEVELECIMRRLIHTRVLLLNILNN